LNKNSQAIRFSSAEGDRTIQIPAILQILIVFVLVVFLTSRKVHLGLAAIIGGLAIALWRGLSLGTIAEVIFADVFSADTILLVCLMSLIMVFSSAMKKAGAMDRLARSIIAVAPSRRIAIALAPMLIGTLPVPGGAVLSAPMVESMNSEGRMSPDALSAANYFFRHIMELIWPLYPAFVMTLALAQIPAFTLLSLQFYSAPLLFFLGTVFLLPKKTWNGEAKKTKTRPGEKKESFIAGIAPLAIALGSYGVFTLLWGLLSPVLGLPKAANALIARYATILLGLAAGCIYVGLGKTGFSVFKGSLKSSTFRLILVLVGIRIFSALLGAAGAALEAAAELERSGFPPVVATALIPLAAGLVTGVGYGYVGLAFPIVFGMIPSDGAFPKEATITLAAAFGYAGMMLSPLHVCMVVSAEHFKAKLPSTIRRVALPVGIFLLIAIAYSTAIAAIVG
jgi:integral membrane protein (TIGR00529 family)